MRTPLDVYVFRDRHFAPIGDTVVCVSDRESMEEVFAGQRMQALFEGRAVYTSDETKQDDIGVWGKRKASRLRRLLREHGADLRVHRVPPPGVRLRHWTTHSRR